ncbi:sialic acid TRAP transporter substrate-binding protein SiaP [Pelagibius sp. Alg239-R121]|uniref:sialic acid TRAP transporter substrate-binding protein SiaP n=1 Tax=Pelagibius sp. Alg239-R121 TaxID=2993448 RepID=UPI0024A65665|nr:sialic acid TRAP transporter substrate-binding protein SiaP [Pelagibius sp. Alg239-R121]
MKLLKPLVRTGALSAAFAAVTLVSASTGFSAFAADKIQLRMSTPATETDFRSQGLATTFADGVSEFATYEPHYNDTLFKQGTELVAIARGNLEMSITSAQELAKLIPEWSIFTAGYLMRDAEHQRKVFEGEIGKEMYQLVEDKLGVKLLSVMYFGTRQLNLRIEKEIKTPADLDGVKLRMPGTDAWQFLGKALGANPTPMAFTEVYTGLQTGAIDGQDNPLPTDKDKKFYEVTKQIVLTGHLADMNFLAFSKKTWDSLSADQQKTVMDSAQKASAEISKTILANEAQLVDFFKGEGLKVYTPDVASFRDRAQKMYLESDFSKDWPKGLLERINAVK